jgi:hypothetical protein
MALQLSEDRRRREACEPIAPVRVESLDRLQEAETGYLHQVVERLVRVVVTKRHLARERYESLYELVAGTAVTVLVGPEQFVVFGPRAGRCESSRVRQRMCGQERTSVSRFKGVKSVRRPLMTMNRVRTRLAPRRPLPAVA